jgi:hypothetical protein
MHAQAFGCFKDREVFAEAEPNSFCLLFSGESSFLSVDGVYCGVSRRLNDLSIEPGEDQLSVKDISEAMGHSVQSHLQAYANFASRSTAAAFADAGTMLAWRASLLPSRTSLKLN